MVSDTHVGAAGFLEEKGLLTEASKDLSSFVPPKACKPVGQEDTRSNWQGGYEVVLLDMTPANSEFARRRIKRAKVQDKVTNIVEGSIADLSRFADNAFDAVVCLGGTLSHRIVIFLQIVFVLGQMNV